MVFSNHGCVCSCVGPIIDVQMKCKLFYKDKFMIIQIRPVSLVQRDVFLPSVYDALLVIRPSCNFRDGRVIQNANFRQYFIELPFHDGYLFALIHLIPANYRSTLNYLGLLSDINTKDIILGFAPVFLFINTKPIMLQRCFKNNCIRIYRWFVHLESTFCSWVPTSYCASR